MRGFGFGVFRVFHRNSRKFITRLFCKMRFAKVYSREISHFDRFAKVKSIQILSKKFRVLFVQIGKGTKGGKGLGAAILQRH